MRQRQAALRVQVPVPLQRLAVPPALEPAADKLRKERRRDSIWTQNDTDDELSSTSTPTRQPSTPTNSERTAQLGKQASRVDLHWAVTGEEFTLADASSSRQLPAHRQPIPVLEGVSTRAHLATTTWYPHMHEET